MQKEIDSMVRIFPDFEEKIDFLFRTDENFRDLCSDYMLCAGSMQDMKKESNKYKEQIEEYEELQRDLQQEILQMLTRKE